jgi:N-hydroxyarylamine O-acetyltransferase
LHHGGVDLAAYLDRIGIDRPRQPDLDSLRRLVVAHTERIPFEGLDAFLHLGAPSLDVDALLDKLVRARRGGWCFEHNVLFKAVLEAVGYEVTPLVARVVWGREPDVESMRTHSLLRVPLDGVDHLVDVGFGGNVLTGVLRLEEGVEQPTPHGPFRLGRIGHELVMEPLVAGAWQAMYRFDLQPQVAPLDYQAANWWLSTNEDSHFRTNLIVARPGPGVRCALLNRRLTVHHVDGPSEKRLLATPEELRSVLDEVFGIDAPPELDAAFDRLPVD